MNFRISKIEFGISKGFHIGTYKVACACRIFEFGWIYVTVLSDFCKRRKETK
jgi:hypothetical protein